MSDGIQEPWLPCDLKQISVSEPWFSYLQSRGWIRTKFPFSVNILSVCSTLYIH